jgi:putative flippase GtrA
MDRRCRLWFQKLKASPKYAPVLQFVKFGLVGAGNTLLSLGLYWLFLYAFGWHYQLANALSFLLSVANAYYWNSRYVFRAARGYAFRQHAAAFGKTLASYGVTFLLNTALLTLLVEALRVSEGLAPLLAVCVTIPLNFLLNKYWAFRDGHGGARPAAGADARTAPEDANTEPGEKPPRAEG